MTTNLLVFLSGMAAAFAAGAGLAFGLARRPRGPSPAVEDQWLAEIAALRARCDSQHQTLEAASAGQDQAAAELEQLRSTAAALQHQVGSYLKQYAVAKDTLKKEILHKNALRTELAAAQAEVEALRARVAELKLKAELDATASRRALSR